MVNRWHKIIRMHCLFVAVPAERDRAYQPVFLDYIIRSFVWAGIVLPPQLMFIWVILHLDPGIIISSFVISKYPAVTKALSKVPLSSTTNFILNTAVFLVRYTIALIVAMDLFRGFILLGIAALMGTQLFKNLVDFAHAYFDRVVILGRQSTMKHILGRYLILFKIRRNAICK